MSETGSGKPRVLSRPEEYQLAAEADADLRVVRSELERWRVGVAAKTRIRERIRRVAVAMGLTA